MKAFVQVQMKESIVLLLVLLIGPALFTALFCFLVVSSKGEQQIMPYSQHEMKQFPELLRKLPIAFTPVNADTTRIMDGVKQQLGFTDVRHFVDLPTMQSHFVEANLRGVADDSIQKFEELIQANEAALPFTLDKNAFHTFLTTDYKQNYLNLPISAPPAAEPLLFGIHFDYSADHMNYSVYFNQHLLQDYQYKNVDTFSRYFTAANEATFTPYGFFVQSAIENQLLPTPLTHRLGAISRTDSSSSLAYITYQLACILPAIAPGVLFQIFSGQLRQQYSRLPKRLGAGEIQYNLCIFIVGFILLFISMFLQMIVSSLFGVEPFASFNADTWTVLTLLKSLTQLSFCMLLSILIQNQHGQVICQLILSFTCSTIFMVISINKGGYNTMFDGQFMGKNLIWAVFCILPPLTLFGISDWWAGLDFLYFTSDAEKTLKNLVKAGTRLVWTQDKKVQFEYPEFSDLCIAVCIQSLVIFILVVYLSKVLNQANQIGLPPLFFLDKKFFKLSKRTAAVPHDAEVNDKTLTFSGVSKKYGSCKKQKEVLRDISFSARTGQIVGLMGLSGCGKTTICRITQHEIQAGRGSQIKFEDMDLLDQYSSLYTHVVASCPQDKSNIMQNASIKDNIRVCKEYIRWTEKSIDMDGYIESLTKILKLAEHQDKKYDELSGGMQRRLSLLIALIQTPQVLVLDEITANVDPQLKHDIWNVLNDYQQKFNRIIVITSHDSFELQYICSNVVHIHDGVVQTNSSVFQMLKDKGMKEHTASINELFFKTPSTEIFDKLSNDQSNSQENSEQQLIYPDTKKHQRIQINYLKFALNLRAFWNINNKFISYTLLIILSIIFGFVYVIIFNTKTYKDNTDPQSIIKSIIVKYKIENQADFQQALKNPAFNEVQISKQAPTTLSMQTLKNLVFFDSLSQYQMSLGDYSMFVGEMMMPHQYVNYLVQDGADVDPVAQYKAVFQQTACTSLDYHVSSAVHSGCSAPVLQDFVPRVADFGGQAFNTPIYVNFSSMKKAKEYISKHAPEKEYNFKYLDQTLDFQISRFVPYPLSIIDHHGDVIDVYVRTPAVSLAIEKFTDISVPKMFYSVCQWSNIFNTAVDSNVTSIVNYENDFLTKYHSKLIKKNDPSWKYLSANFIQQPYIKQQQDISFIQKIDKGQLQFGYFYSLALCLLILSTINSYYHDSAKILRNQLEGIGQLQVKQILSQVVVNFLQILATVIIFVVVFLIFDSTPQHLNWKIYLTLILEAFSHAVLLQVYLLIFNNLSTLILVMCATFALSFFMIGYLNMGQYQSLILTIVLPGYYFFYMASKLSYMYYYHAYEWAYPIILNIAELVIALFIVYAKGRKQNKKQIQTDVMIDAKNVCAGYKKTKILKNMTVQLRKGESISLIGNNGCGKTTFIKFVLHQLKFSGELTHTDDIAIIPQDDIVFKDLTVKQYFKAVGTYDEKLLAQLGMMDCLDQKYQQLSGGQRRRLSIALVLSLNPSVLVLDEVTAGSDFIMKKAIWDSINQLSQTKIIITHDMAEVKMNGDKICVLKKGVSSMLENTQVGWMVVVYDCLPAEPGFAPFFDKFVKKIESQAELHRVVAALEAEQRVFTIEENGLEVVFLE
ncbi:ABC_transporter family protein [Hexamita inflata]|uniref:ABC transporter family protein n=1 Tax=Hexamita inflata TaxID=28002 RepID=A0AA86QAZ2_9EUKA|nr:ABC transporter family protein [Hexamita inflata]CAI9963408.1 ABC transporter family protein [Hexamita inflata]